MKKNIEMMDGKELKNLYLSGQINLCELGEELICILLDYLTESDCENDAENLEIAEKCLETLQNTEYHEPYNEDILNKILSEIPEENNNSDKTVPEVSEFTEEAEKWSGFSVFHNIPRGVIISVASIVIVSAGIFKFVSLNDSIEQASSSILESDDSLSRSENTENFLTSCESNPDSSETDITIRQDTNNESPSASETTDNFEDTNSESDNNISSDTDKNNVATDISDNSKNTSQQANTTSTTTSSDIAVTTPVNDITVFSMSSASCHAGETVKLTVSVQNNKGFAGLNLTIDCGNLKIKDAVQLNTQNTFVASTQNKSFVWLNSSSYNCYDNGDFFVIEFEVPSDTPSGKYEVSMNFEIANEDFQAVEFESKSGYITVL